MEVKGRAPERGEIALPLDGKAALMRYSRLSFDAAPNSSTLDVELVTGRKHQIRRRFAESGLPMLGDPAYGENNKDARGLQLFAGALGCACPLTERGRLGALMLSCPPTEAPAKHRRLAERPFSSVHQLQ